MDFLKIGVRVVKNGIVEVAPKFRAKSSKDLMIRGGDFYAIWNENVGLWSTNQDDAVDLIDAELTKYVREHPELEKAQVKYMWDSDSGSIDKWHKYVQKQLRDNYHPLDETLIFANTPVNKTDYASKRLPYALEEGDISAYEEMISTLYSPEERMKIEWAIGAVVTGDSKDIQKFLVFYGPGGTGKSTILHIIEQLFDGYYATFDAKALTSSSDAFALEPFRNNPLVAIQHDGDLSKIENNARLNSVVSHEEMVVNEKFKSQYNNRFKAFLFMGTNKPVKITDSRSGIIRRLIDVSPTEKLIPNAKYEKLRKQIKFELGGIAWHCKQVYEANKDYYNHYIPEVMLGATNDFYNFIFEEMLDSYLEHDETTLNESWLRYQAYCNDAKVPYPYKKSSFKEELKNYFDKFDIRGRNSEGVQVKNYYSGFRRSKFLKHDKPAASDSGESDWLDLHCVKSLFDEEYADCAAQLAKADKSPQKAWSRVTTTLKDIDTQQLHYVKVPLNLIVIDFDKKDENGHKSRELNIEAARSWPKTYAEYSMSGAALHLHYIYTGDPEQLENLYEPDVEIKVFKGGAALRRRLSYCNDIPIATISSGLPLKGAKSMINVGSVQSEKGLRTLIKNNLAKQYHPGTKPSIDFIYKILDDAYHDGLTYDVSDMRPAVLSFAMNSTNHATYCVKVVNQMHFKSDEISTPDSYTDDVLMFFDVEVFPNLFVIVYKAAGKPACTMINPSPAEVEFLLKFKLVGFNNRRYDNHILYARMMGYNNRQLYELSQRIISGSKNAFFGEAYNLSYTDIYDFSSKKQSLKKFEIELRIHHQELGLPWDQPVPEELWNKVAEYCVNDVVATEAVFNARQQDFIARKVLAELSGLTVNDTTRMHSTAFIFGKEKHPPLIYTDLSEMFPGYKYENGHSSYRGEDPGEGGYVYSEPGMYNDVALLDIASMHPSSIIALNLFGPYTERFKAILDARLAIKHHDYEKARTMLGGVFAGYLTDDESADSLAKALKIVINSVYGYTTATFDNPFKDPRNVDNIVAKRGALFMINLKHEVQSRGFVVAHIKTDSIKIPNATPEIIQFVMDYGKQYGYNFEHEATYDKMCLVNDAVYIAKYKGGKHDGEWTATGTQFQVPYVFKTLFSHEPVEFDDLCETKTVSTSLYLDLNESLPEGEHNYHFVGRAGLFCPMKAGAGGGTLLREKDGKYYAVGGTKGYRWMESELVQNLKLEDEIDISYYERLADDAAAAIEEYGDFAAFAS